MFCSKCGTKNVKGAKFCKSCGAAMKGASSDKISTEEESKKQKENKESVNNRKKLDFTTIKEFIMKHKFPAIIVAIVVLLLIVYSAINNTVFSEKSFAKKYAEAVITGDHIQELKYADVYGDSEFITKEIVNNKYKDEEKKEIEQIKLLSNNEIKKITLDKVDKSVESLLKDFLDKDIETIKSSLTDTYVFEYITKGSKESKYLTVNVTKAKCKNYLIFNNWKALGEDYVAENIEVKANPDTTVQVEGITLSKKYLDKEESTKSTNVYKIPSILKDNVSIIVKSKNGLTLERIADTYSKATINTTSTYGYHMTKSSEKKLKSIVESFLTDYVEAAVNNKSIDEVKSSKILSSEVISNSDFESSYNSIVSKFADSKIESYKIKDIDVSSSYINLSGEIVLKAKINYSYKYKDDSTRSKKEGDTSTTINLRVSEDEFKIVNFYTYNIRYMF